VRGTPPGRHYAYARVSDAEYAVLKARATAAGLSISNYVRRAINSLWLEEDNEDGPLLDEKETQRGRPSKA